ncbi:cobalt-precorrin-6A reductase [Pelagibacterium limicola]|uniref:cobalt-precorrin-6A reductase n=1 Tax=Pelagibacterium limicola TaxID=2791022 RepID=UPI001FEC4D3C|nr:cobalt-precorrin-6A reductase [Pelagibacterium limicola]
MGERKRILILGGTGEARALASNLIALGHEVTSSLAGRTRAPQLPPGPVRMGGFGGVDGLAAYMQEGGFTHLVDATHPFAAQISGNAVIASAKTGIPLLRLEREVWLKPESANWLEVPTMEVAAESLPAGARVLLTIGRQEVGAFFGRADCQFVARVIESPETVPEGWKLIAVRGPFSLEDEIGLMRRHGITHLVSKNSGGDAGFAKLEAAAALGIEVLMVRRPKLPDAPTASTVEEVLKRI